MAPLMTGAMSLRTSLNAVSRKLEAPCNAASMNPPLSEVKVVLTPELGVKAFVRDRTETGESIVEEAIIGGELEPCLTYEIGCDLNVTDVQVEASLEIREC